MPRETVEDYEAAIERILDRNGAKQPVQAKPRHPWAHGIAGWWIVLFFAGTIFTVVFDPPGFFPVFILTAAVTMPVFVIAAVIATGPRSVRQSWGGCRLPHG